MKRRAIMTLGAVTGLSLFIVISADAQLVRLPADYCEHMKVKPNLHVGSSMTIRGTLLDGSGEVLRNTEIEVRRFESARKQVVIAKSTTNAAGSFEIADVPKGNYRLIVLTRLFRQPRELWCKGDSCVLDITLDAMPTDMPESQCPIK